MSVQKPFHKPQDEGQYLLPTYLFQNPNLLLQALTHSSWGNEHGKGERHRGGLDNERLEFLGDAILQLLASERLFAEDGLLSEGHMTSLRQLIVREESLASASRNLDLDKHLRLGIGEESTGGRTKDSNLADAYEAVLAAVYLDAESQGQSGLNAARELFDWSLGPIVDQALEGTLIYDYKSKILEWLQSFPQARGQRFQFEVLAQEGPAHDPSFEMGLFFKGECLYRCVASSKKLAEQELSRMAWKDRVRLEEVILK